jgi:3-hydroxyisobutyrate dehydrogenase-like beta-hydroxyacid dehydrogenase
MRERIGFLGLGMMGSRMAQNILDCGFPLTVWTHTHGKAAQWASRHGADVADTPAAVAKVSDIVVSMVVDGPQVSSVMLGEHGLIEAAREGLLCVDMSTIGPSATREIGAVLNEAGVALIDAPVTGSLPRAEAGTLTIMVGGQESDFARAKPLLEAMGELIVHVGELGKGQMLKVIGNSLGAANASAVAEAMVLASASGVDLDAFVEVTSAGSGGSAQLSMKSGAMRAHDYAPLFRTEHLLKDVRLCLEQARTHGVPFLSAAHAAEILSATVGRGHAQEDYSALIETVEGLAGRRV